jgi:hypothetical protein
MVNISKMAKAAGIGSAVGATIGGIKESRDKDGDILGGIVGGAFVGSIGGAGVSLGKQMLQSKLTDKAYNQSVSDSVMAKAKNTYAKHGAPNPNKDLKVAEQVSKATAGNTTPVGTDVFGPAAYQMSFNKNNVRIETQHFDDIFDKKYDIPYDPSNPSVAYKNLERAREHVSNTSSLNKNNITIQRYYDKNTGKQIFENIFNN